MTPAEVRETTLEDFNAAVAGWCRAQGASERPAGMTKDDLARLIEWDENGRQRGTYH